MRKLSSHGIPAKGISRGSSICPFWLVDGLMEAGYGVHLANTAAIQQYSGLKYTDDKHVQDGNAVSPCGHGREPIVVWGGRCRQGPAGLACKGSPRHRLDPDG